MILLDFKGEKRSFVGDQELKSENFQPAQTANAFPNQVTPKGLFQIPENILRLIP